MIVNSFVYKRGKIYVQCLLLLQHFPPTPFHITNGLNLIASTIVVPETVKFTMEIHQTNVEASRVQQHKND